MSMRGLHTRFTAIWALSSVGLCVAAALGQDAGDVVSETITKTAERWGLWAALSVVMISTAIYGLIYLTRFTLSKMMVVIDDNTLSNLLIWQALDARPCLHDVQKEVDIKALKDTPGPIGEVSQRVLARQEERKQSKPK